MSAYLFDIVIPTLNAVKAAKVVANLGGHAEYPHNYIIVDTGDCPVGYTDPCNKGFRAGDASIVCFVNDDVQVNTVGWDTILLEEAKRSTYCFGPWTPEEDTMKLNGWFLCLRRDYADVYGGPFDDQFKVWCGDIDLLMRLEADGFEPVLVKGIDIRHEYSKTCSRPDLQEWIIPQQLRDIDNFKLKWNKDPNQAKIRN